ncbi:MAG: hypothetical protein WB564_07480 [Dehalococcoidia bacterium]
MEKEVTLGYFQDAIEGPDLRKKQLTWQHLRRLIAESPLDELSYYPSTHAFSSGTASPHENSGCDIYFP